MLCCDSRNLSWNQGSQQSIFPEKPIKRRRTIEQEQNNGLGITLLAFALGAAIGGGLAVLTAPRSGVETREKFKDRVDESRQNR